MDFVVYELHSLVFICSIGKSRLQKAHNLTLPLRV